MKLKELKRKIRFFYLDHIYHFTKLENYVRFFKWIPVIWNDRDWDWLFLLKILRHKLNNDRNYYIKFGIHLRKDKQIRDMKVCVNLLDRLIADEYDDIYQKELEKKWGDYEGVFCLSRVGVVTEEDRKQYNKDCKKAFEKADYAKKQDLELLFTIMKKKLFSWWD